MIDAKTLDYDSLQRFKSYWQQIREIAACSPETVLEAGEGTGFLKNYLTRLGLRVKSLDMEGSPDYKLNLELCTADELPKEKFDVVACFQTLEHIEWAAFGQCLKKLGHMSKKHVIISLPESRTAYRFVAPKIRFTLQLPFKHKIDTKIHRWEISHIPLEKVREAIRDSGFTIKKDYRYTENLYHHFFVLEKSGQ